MKYLCILFLFVSFSPVFGNNIRVEGKTRVVNFIGNDTAVIEVKLYWDNSWRDDFNWDAAWVFFKYKKRGIENAWQHAYLSSSGHTLMPLSGNEGGGYTFMTGISSGQVTGLYIMREEVSEGNAGLRLQVKWPLSGTGLSPSDFGEDYDGLYVAVHAIEMVYIPYGAYYLGDNFSHQGFTVGDTSAVVVDSEAALNLHVTGGSSYSLSASYPKGYAGFYIMKYETSQEQYVEFLNSLTLEQQKARVMNNDFSRIKRGDYVFGDLKSPDCRNGVAFIGQKTSASPAVFGNNLNADNDFFSSDDGQTLACNYLSIEDMLSYCSWSGLRPMSELEYEKSCRRFYPQLPDKGEYAWNTNNGVEHLTSLHDLSYQGDQREQALNYRKNVNSGSGNSIHGPVRCGLFATSATNQTQAGATYWGVMEMSGNVKELCVNVSYSNFDGGSSGSGIYDSGRWENTAGKYGVRGGGFSSSDSLLRTSARTEAMNYFRAVTQRDSTVGFRGVYSLSGIKINGGEICNTEDTACWSGTEIVNVKEASCPDFPDVRFQYNWYVKKPGEVKYDIIANATGISLNYGRIQNKTAAPVVYTFRRTGICSMGVAESNEVKVKILPEPFGATSYTFNPCPVTIPHRWSGLIKEWRIPNNPQALIVEDGGNLLVNNLTANGIYTLEAQSDRCPEVFTTQINVVNTVVLTATTTYGYTGKAQCVVLPAGKYQIECWGARGCSVSGYFSGGNGGYTKGQITLEKPHSFYVYVGMAGQASGRNQTWPVTFNGGGGAQGNPYSIGGSGGGASDVRIVYEAWNNFESLKSRVMVAAGGGGGFWWSGVSSRNGGYGGGLTGGEGAFLQDSRKVYSTNATGGTQTTGGLSNRSNTTLPLVGRWGIGGTGSVASGGGGGYYGGGGGKDYGYCPSAGAGGSSFISGHNGCNAISGSSTATRIIHTGQAIHYSGLYFINTSMTAGSCGGHGQVRITPVK